jgi:hypothetical protein
MANWKQKKHKRQLNMDTFSDGIKGRVIDAVSISNELECRYISLEFEDKTELTITLDTRLTGKLELFDCKTGDHRPCAQDRIDSRRRSSLATEGLIK